VCAVPTGNEGYLASLAASVRQVPIVVVPSGTVGALPGDRRLQAGTPCDSWTDTLYWATVCAHDEAEALVLGQSLRSSERHERIGGGWLPGRTEDRFGYSLDELARRFDRSAVGCHAAWLSLNFFPGPVQQKSERGNHPHVAMSFWYRWRAPTSNHMRTDGRSFGRPQVQQPRSWRAVSAWRDTSPHAQTGSRRGRRCF